MASLLRIEFAGALYHIISRGNKKADIYLDDDDREGFLVTLNEVYTRFNWVTHV